VALIADDPPAETPRSWQQQAGSRAARGRVRLRTLSNLRWLAIAGQSIALLLVYFGFGYHLPLVKCIAAIATSAFLNLALTLRYPSSHRLTGRDATIYLGYDILQLAALLYLTGGISNPFALMFIAPVVIAAGTLDLGNTLILAVLAFLSICAIAVWHAPLPWSPTEHLELPPLYQAGIWSSLVIGIGFTSIYAWRIASENARMSAGLAATQLALEREHRLSAIGALATAAAHELGTPLGTIAVVARELERALPQGSPEYDDARLLREQAERCRAILTKLSRPEETMLEEAQRLPLGALLDDIAAPYRGEDVEIAIEISENNPPPEPQVWRAPEHMHGLGNIRENAADFARTKVSVHLRWDENWLRVSVEDDGPGFLPEIFERIGEPYTTSRPGHYALAETEIAPEDDLAKHEGMGLGFFIAKTLIERTGGSLTAGNLESGGARVSAAWPRGAIDGEAPVRPGSP
jgi:two-component system sensor histidine kinase RegB